jgi:hypothetical protein
MKKSHFLRLKLAVFAIFFLFGGPARTVADEGPSPSIGQRIDRAVGQLRDEAKDIGDQLREGFEQARASVDRMGITARVYARLHWDKALSGASVTVDIQKGGKAILTGTVPTPTAKSKAGSLAEDTVGVAEVENRLQVSK